MRNSLIGIVDKILLIKRFLIEVVNDEANNIVQMEYSIRCFFSNFIVDLFSVVAVYCFSEKKFIVDVRFINNGLFAVF